MDTFVECLHYSTEYPSGCQRKGDLMLLSQEHLDHFLKLRWVRKLPEILQKKHRETFKGTADDFRKGKLSLDLSKKNYHKRR